jgi:hypothetical protein
MENRESIEQLRAILERQRAKVITFEQAAEIAESLLIFFQVLGENASDGQQV